MDSMEFSMAVNLLPCKKIYFHGNMEQVGGSRFTSTEVFEVCGNFHGISFHRRWKWNLPLLPSIGAFTNTSCGSFHEIPYTPTYLHLLQRVPRTSRCLHATSRRVHKLPFDLLPWKFPPLTWKSVEEYLLPCKFPCKLVKAYLLPWKLVEASMEIDVTFHCRWIWKLPPLPSVALNTNPIRRSFH